MRPFTNPAHKGLALLTGAVCVIVLAGCGGSDRASSSTEAGLPGVYSAVAGLSGAARQAKLLDLAKKEGNRVSLYTSLNGDNVKPVIAAFTKRYGIPVTLFRGHTSDVRTRLEEEAKAGRKGADVAATGAIGMTDIYRDGLLSDYTSPVTRELIPAAHQKGWVAETLESFVLAWNSKRVPAAQRPTSWESLADPRWKGKVGIADNDYEWFKTLHDYWVGPGGKTEAEADRLMEAIARNAVFVHGESLLAQLLASGEYDVALSQSALIDDLAAQGAPVAWKPAVTPVMPLPLGSGLVRGARHPAAGVLFIDWLLGPQGQKALMSKRYGSVRKDTPFLAGIAQYPVNVPSLAAANDEWSNRWDKLVKLGKAGPSS